MIVIAVEEDARGEKRRGPARKNSPRRMALMREGKKAAVNFKFAR